MTFLDASLGFFFGTVSIALILALVRLLRGPGAADRIVALDLIGLLCATLFAGHAISVRDDNLLDVVLVISLVLFFGTVAFANLLHRSNHHD